LDTLNRSFSSSALSKDRVLAGSLNPNAVNCYIKFVLAVTPPSGHKLSSPGFNLITTDDGEYPELTLTAFQKLEEENAWPPNQYINIWLASGYNFEFPSIQQNEAGSFDARGLVYSPFIEKGFLLEGLSNIGANPKDPDPATLSHGILLRSGSVLFAHPDYIINRMGYYLGLFDTMSFACLLEGDFCPDTQIPDLTQSLLPFAKATTCEGSSFPLTNHMSIGRRYTNFTYDQRTRMRFVLEHGLYRPRKN
jgi:hypothetical protein